MLAHTLGNPFDLTKVKKFCDDNQLWLIEDNCDSLGSRYLYEGEWRYTGTIGDLGTSSFSTPNHMTTGEGGAVYTNNYDPRPESSTPSGIGGGTVIAPSESRTPGGARFSQQFGELPYGIDDKYVFSHFGYNMKVTDMQAAIGCAQLEKLPDFIQSRRRNWKTLRGWIGRPRTIHHPAQGGRRVRGQLVWFHDIGQTGFRFLAG